MDIDSEVPGFSNQCRLFPLPDLVFFPHTVLPLHIFEPRYRQMTEDALAGDRLVTMVQIRPAPRVPRWPSLFPSWTSGAWARSSDTSKFPTAGLTSSCWDRSGFA